MLKNNIKHILRQKQKGFFCRHKKAALSTIKHFHVFLMQDGSRVVSGSDDKTVRIWSTMTHEIEAELKGHTDLVRSVAFAHIRKT